jgi:hypothetical protein
MQITIFSNMEYQMAQNELRALMANPGINAQRIIELQQAIDAWLRR